VFPYLPSEFGGPEVSCVSLDLKRNDFSEATLELVTARDRPGTQTEIVRSRSLNLLSAPGRYYLIAVPSNGKVRYMKMNTDLVHAIVPADNCDASSRS
jgi:hypothetical protein